MGWWWAAYVVASVRFVGGGEANTDRRARERCGRPTPSQASGSLAAIAAAVLLILVVRRITRRQEALFAGSPSSRLRAQTGLTPICSQRVLIAVCTL